MSETNSQAAINGVSTAAIAAGASVPVAGWIAAGLGVILSNAGFFKGRTQHLDYAQQVPLAENLKMEVLKQMQAAGWEINSQVVGYSLAKHTKEWIDKLFPEGTTWTSYRADTFALLNKIYNAPNEQSSNEVLYQTFMYMLGNYDSANDNEINGVIIDWSQIVCTQVAVDMKYKIMIPTTSRINLNSSTNPNSATPQNNPSNSSNSISNMFAGSNMNYVYLFAGFIIVLIIISKV